MTQLDQSGQVYDSFSAMNAGEYADRNYGAGIVPEDRAITSALFQALNEFGVQPGDLRTGVIHFAGVNRIPELWMMRLGIEPTSIVFAENGSELEFRAAMHDPQGDGVVQYVDPDGTPQSLRTKEIWEKFVPMVDAAAQPYYPGSFDGDPLQRDITVQAGNVFDFTPEQFRTERADAADRTPDAAIGGFPRADGRQKYHMSVELFGADSAFVNSKVESAALSPDERWSVPPEQLDRRWAALDCLIDSAEKIAVSGLALNDGTGWLAGDALLPNSAYSREAMLAYASSHPRVKQVVLFESRTGEVAFSATDDGLGLAAFELTPLGQTRGAGEWSVDEPELGPNGDVTVRARWVAAGQEAKGDSRERAVDLDSLATATRAGLNPPTGLNSPTAPGKSRSGEAARPQIAGPNRRTPGLGV